jgi:hypothetical protein
MRFKRIGPLLIKVAIQFVGKIFVPTPQTSKAKYGRDRHGGSVFEG